MATAKKTKGVLLDSLLNKTVKVKDYYSDNPEGPFILRGIDQGFICLEIKGETFWWSLKKIEGLSEWKEPQIESN